MINKKEKRRGWRRGANWRNRKELDVEKEVQQKISGNGY